MADSKSNPNDVWAPNQNYAQLINLTRPDASIVGPGGNVVDRSRINKTGAGLDKGSQTAQKPLGGRLTDDFGG